MPIRPTSLALGAREREASLTRGVRPRGLLGSRSLQSPTRLLRLLRRGRSPSRLLSATCGLRLSASSQTRQGSLVLRGRLM